MESRHELSHQFAAWKSPSKSIKCLERLDWLASYSLLTLEACSTKRAAGFLLYSLDGQKCTNVEIIKSYVLLSQLADIKYWSLVFLVSGASYEASTRHHFHQFCLTLLSERGVLYKTNANEVSYEASYEVPLTRKNRLEYYKSEL